MTTEPSPNVALLTLEYTPLEEEGVPCELLTAEGKLRQDYSIEDGATLRIGRAQTNDIVVPDWDVSRFHAMFTGSVSGLILSDLHSTNGTFVNGRRISNPVDLQNGDVITMGKATLTTQLLLVQDLSIDADVATKVAELQPTEVTVLLVDVCGYTKMSQALPADAVTGMLRRWFELAAPIIAAHDGEIDKYIGDCVMALWRNPKEPSAKLAQAAARAALEIVSGTKDLTTDGYWPHYDTHPWQCRAALHSGTALVGTVGAGTKRNYTVLGDTINATFRIETLARTLGKNIILSKATADLIGGAANVTSLGGHTLDDRTGETQIYSLEGIE